MNNIAFNARANHAVKADQIYRVYCEEKVLFFIRISGQPLSAGVAAGLQAQLGGLGRMMGKGLVKKSKKKIQQAADEADKKGYRRLVQTEKNSFWKRIEEIQSSEINPPKVLSAHGEHEGLWNLQLRDGKELKFQFEEVEDLKIATGLLPRILGQQHANSI